MTEQVIIVRNPDGDIVGVLQSSDARRWDGFSVATIEALGGDLSAEAFPVESLVDFVEQAKGETCACGQWPLAEYGPRCPSCPVEATS